jgi:hypothetical protein
MEKISRNCPINICPADNRTGEFHGRETEIVLVAATQRKLIKINGLVSDLYSVPLSSGDCVIYLGDKFWRHWRIFM